VSLEPKAFRVLVFLLEHPGRLIEKEELLSAIWGDAFVTENALARAIALLRKTLGDTKSPAKYIETVPTRGYRFIASATHEADVKTPADAPAGAGLPPSNASSRPWVGIVLCSMVTAAIAVGVVSYLQSRNKHSLEPPDFRLLQVTSSTALDIFPSFSPDGNTIAYSSDESGSFEIYLKQLTRGGRVVQLTNDGTRNLQPAWSPDGTTIAYYSHGRRGIWLIPALGGVARQLTTFGASPAWSPDSTQIVFQSGGIRDLNSTSSVSIAGSTLWITAVKEGTPHQLTQLGKPEGAHNSPAWSPDGKTIAFVGNSLGAPEILWTVSADGGRLQQVGAGANLFNPIFARDGRHIYVSAFFGIWEVALFGKKDQHGFEKRKIFDASPEVSRYLAISADGRKIAFSRVKSLSNIYSLPMAGDNPAGSPIPLTHDTHIRKTDPDVSPDGQRVLFDVGSFDRNGGVWTVDADGKNASPVLVPCGTPRWLPGSQDFLCASYIDETGHGCKIGKCWSVDIVKVHLAAGTTERVFHLAQDFNFPAFTRDGKQVAFMSEETGTPNVWVASLSGGAPKQVTFDSESMGFPTWSPDGKLLAIEQKQGDSTYIWLAKPGEAPVQVTFAPGQNWPGSWSPDGSKIVFAANRDGIWNLWWVSVKDRMEKQITSYTRQNEYVRYPAWSPTGRAIVYEYAETTGNVWILELR
jgi:Tol biopolymer transport system component